MKIKNLIPYFFFISSIVFAKNSEPSKNTICLNMIVKNESKVIKRCLNSVKPLIDYWVIVDTGSEDNTQEIIREFMSDIPGELHEEPWVNFSHNRNHALNLARDKAEYLLFIDADEEFILEDNFIIPNLDKDFYFIKSEYGGMEYQRLQLIHNDSHWHWHGKVHEVLKPHSKMKGDRLIGLTNLVRFEGCVSQDPEAFKKDTSVFETELRQNPQDTRSMFYLAQSCRDNKEFDKSLLYYERRAIMGGWQEEVFWSLYQIAKLQQALKYNPNVFLKSFYKAHTYRPNRIEPLYYIAKYYRENSRWEEGYSIAKLALTSLDAKQIENELLFVEKWIYEYGMLLELSICAYRLKKYDEAKSISQQILKVKGLPDNYTTCIKTNLKWIDLSLDPKKIIEKM